MKISFDTNSCNPHNSTTTSARFSNILRRLFCAGSLQTHPFESVKCQFYESNIEIQEKMDNSVTPGLVARLMGLETMPGCSSLDTNKSFIGRSRSVNSLDYTVESERQHRRVKSLSSSRERLSFLEKEDDEFLVLVFENEAETSSIDVKQRRRHHGKENRGVEDEGSRKEQNCGKRNSKGKRRRKISNMSSGTNCDSNLKEKELQHGRKEVELECNSDNSSPVSVLDLNEFTSDPESPLSEEDSRLKVSSPRRKLSTEPPTSECPVSISNAYTPTVEVRELKSGNVQVTKTPKMDSRSEDYVEVWGQICKMVEEDMQVSTWIQRELCKIEDLEEIRCEIGIQILDQLLFELIKE